MSGRLYGLGVGPGDPELITVKALRLLTSAPVVAYFVAKGKKGNAFGIIEGHLKDTQTRMPLVYPVTTEALEPPLCYETIIGDFYDESAIRIADHLEAGRDVAVICEGDPFFYGSYMYLHDRLAERFETEVVPGVCSMLGGVAVLGVPLVYRNQSLSVLSGVLPEADLREKLAATDAAVIMKLGRNFDKVRRVLKDLGLDKRALYVERATMANQRIVPLDDVDPMASPYFSLLVVPGGKMARLNEGNPLAIVVLGPGALGTAKRIQARYPDALIHGLASRVHTDVAFTELSARLRELCASNTPIVALCAAGIVIRCLAPLLADKTLEPPVLAVAEDGSAVVPLLGGLGGVNVMAREIAAALQVAPAITTSGELRFGTCLLNPPAGYVLADIEHGKRFVSDLLAGGTTRIEGDAPWLDQVELARSDDANHAIRISPYTSDDSRELMIHPRSVVICVNELSLDDSLVERIRHALLEAKISPMSVAAMLAPAALMSSRQLNEAAHTLDVPLRFGTLPEGFETQTPNDKHLAISIAPHPVDVATLGQARGTLTVIGLGPGSADLMVPAAKHALSLADDILGYETYVRMAGPFKPHQTLHCTDNREEMQRARHAFELASTGRRVVVVSSGDPGVFAMAAAVLEAFDEGQSNEAWSSVDLNIVPGVSAALATAARAGAPLGHDFCMLSLSDNLKPWTVIETRLRHAAQADLVMAFYNPVSRARPWQLDRALEVVREHRGGTTTVVLGRNIGRPGETLTTTTLEHLRSDQVDMRTMVIIGSSTTRSFPRGDGDGVWAYTPRWYE